MHHHHSGRLSHQLSNDITTIASTITNDLLIVSRSILFTLGGTIYIGVVLPGLGGSIITIMGVLIITSRVLAKRMKKYK